MSNWQRLDTKIVYQNPYMTVHEDNVIDPKGKAGVYGWIETAPGAYIVAIDQSAKVLLVKQVRYVTGQPSWELPGGGVEAEDPLAAAKRELEEEAHLHADKWVQLNGEFYSWNSKAPEHNSVFIARSLHKVQNPAGQTDDSIIDTQWVTWAQIKDMIKNSEITDGQSITALMRAALELGRFK